MTGYTFAVPEALDYSTMHNCRFDFDQASGWETAVRPFWTDTLLDDLQAMPDEARHAWLAVLTHSQTAKGTHPKRDWLAEAQHLQPLLPTDWPQQLTHWLANLPTQSAQHDLPFWQKGTRAEALVTGLLWLSSQHPHPDLAQAVAKVQEFAYESVRARYNRQKTTVRSVQVWKAALWSLQHMGSVALRERQRLSWLGAGLDGALSTDLQQSGLLQIQEERLLPWPFDEEGNWHTTFTPTLALRVTLDDLYAGLEPANLAMVYRQQEEHFPRAYESWRRLYDALTLQLRSVRALLALAMAQQRCWSGVDWLAYVSGERNPLLPALARQLLWRLEGEGCTPCTLVWSADAATWCTLAGEVMPDLNGLPEKSRLRLWHPLFATAHEITLARDWQHQQPQVPCVQQAWRPVYRLSTAEQAATASLQLAGQCVKAAQDRWSVHMPLLHQDPNVIGVDTNIKQPVVEYRLLAEGLLVRVDMDTVVGGIEFIQRKKPLPLAKVPALLYSEVLLELDRCVVANLRPDADAMQAPLTPFLQTRTEILRQILPSLAIASRCTVLDCYLQVRATHDEYHIHLGHAQILDSHGERWSCQVSLHDIWLLRQKIPQLPQADHGLLAILVQAEFLACDTHSPSPYGCALRKQE